MSTDLSQLPVMAVPKPTKKPKKEKAPKKTRSSLGGGGKKPSEVGRRDEYRMTQKYDNYTDDNFVSMRRIPGSGAFVMLPGDLKLDIGAAKNPERKRFRALIENKAYERFDGRGEKIVTFPLSYLTKIKDEAEPEGKFSALTYHPKGETEELFVCFFEDILKYFIETERTIAAYQEQLEEALQNVAA